MALVLDFDRLVSERCFEMGLFTHVRSKSAKRLSKRTVRPVYRAFLFVCLAIFALWSIIHYDPSSAIKTRIGKASHPDSTRRRRLESAVFTTDESERQCQLDSECELYNDQGEEACNADLHCEWYKVLNTCEHSTAWCGENTNKTRCDYFCPTYNWTFTNLTSGESITNFTGDTAWELLEPLCAFNDTISCVCDGEEAIEVHNECEHYIFGVPLELRNEPLHSIWILFLVMYGFVGIAIVCDTYFEPSLETISTKLKLTPDVAGATFMAMGSSAPELFTSLSDNFITKNNVGVGTIVGSALFNILIIVALSAFVARPKKGVAALADGGIIVDWRPVVRDVIFYAISIGLLIGFIIDESVHWYEALVMILAYGCYIIYMTQNPKIIALCDKHEQQRRESAGASGKVAPMTVTVAGPKSDVVKRADEDSDTKQQDKVEDGDVVSETKEQDADKSDDVEKQKDGDDGDADDDDDDDDDDWRVWPTKEEWAEKSCGAKFWFICVAPLHALFWCTIPNCANPNPVLQNLYPLTFINCVLWMAVLCAMETMLVTWLGCWWGISAPVMGIVILAIGTSVPDAIASMIVARGGQGDMAIANAVGSNVFDILFGLGLPWLIADAVFQNQNTCGDYVGVFVDVDGIVGAACLLYGTVLFYVFVLAVSNWKLNKIIAAVYTLMYGFIIALLLVNEYCVNGFTWKAYNDNCAA